MQGTNVKIKHQESLKGSLMMV